MLQKIHFRVVHVTSQDEGYPAKELNHHSPKTKGWRSLFLYKNYPNKLNLQNQIGIVALNFIGEVAGPSFDGDLPRNVERLRSDYVSPIDDLAFDVYQDPRFADVLRRLQSQKLEYARRENFDLARQARDAIRRLQEAGEQIFQLELEKQEAAKAEDYETAKAKKELITEIREELSREIDLNFLLGSTPASASSRDIRPQNAGPFLPPLLPSGDIVFLLTF
ncbi:unnamed protein product [Dibothriocephalus latus]|uniref:UVR domain-containing protein n=1 Tax=Dibothriocephalus latus TaxID=60516 RepID=A0A3P6VDT3_DIBLA|nr:unnamed protein product [Dibothriocephalus latus]